MTGAVVAAGSGGPPFKVGPNLSTLQGYLSGQQIIFQTSHPAPKAGVITSLQADFQNSSGVFALFTHNGGGLVASIISSDIACVPGLQTYAIPSLPIASNQYIGVWFSSTGNGLAYGFNPGFQNFRGFGTKPYVGENLLTGSSNFNGQNTLLQATAQ